MISITAELLGGVIRANSDDATAGARNHQTIEWPPSPARLLAALVAGGGTRGNNRLGSDDTELRQLESAPPPLIAASKPGDRHVMGIRERYVVRDERSKNRVHEYPARTSGLVRPGDRAAPKSRYITYVWPELELDAAEVTQLRRRAARVAYLGCADSPVRLMVNVPTDREDRAIWHPDDDGEALISVPYPGYVAELDRSFDAFSAGASPRARQIRRSRVRYRAPGGSAAPAQPSPIIWLQFDRPFNGRRVMHVGEAVRNAVLSKYDELGLGEPPPALHGHGIQPGDQHTRFVPLPNLGNTWGRGQIMGAAICLPTGVDRRLIGNIEVATAHITRISLPGGSSREASLRPIAASRPWTTNPDRWTKPAIAFASASPVVHERYGKITSSNVLDVVGGWCANAGLPQPIEAGVSRTPYIEGTPNFTARDVWRDGSTQGYPFSYVSLRFESPVAGPVAIGRGRSFGVGLLVPVAEPGEGAGNDE